MNKIHNIINTINTYISISWNIMYYYNISIIKMKIIRWYYPIKYTKSFSNLYSKLNEWRIRIWIFFFFSNVDFTRMQSRILSIKNFSLPIEILRIVEEMKNIIK